MSEFTRPHPAGYQETSPQQIASQLADFRIIDVRQPEEFTGPLGHIHHAELVPLSTVVAAAENWAKDQPLLMVCRSGGRSGQASQVLTQLGFRTVVNLAGGMIAWNEENLPIVN